MLRRGRNPSSSRLSVRPTSTGWQVLAAGAVVLFLARLIGTTQFHQLAYALLALPVASFVLGMAGTRGIGFSRAVPPGTHLTAGETSGVVLELGRSRFGTARARFSTGASAGAVSPNQPARILSSISLTPFLISSYRTSPEAFGWPRSAGYTGTLGAARSRDPRSDGGASQAPEGKRI